MDDATSHMGEFTLIRQRWTLNILKTLDVECATGPDAIAARVLRECANELALPITRLTRKLVAEGIWPECWKLHWVVPMHKKKRSRIPKVSEESI